MTSTTLSCPTCATPLTLSDKSLSCSNNHCFDQAKQGYFNLLLSNKKKSKQPGDNAEMVAARHVFLETGIYQPISDALNQVCREHLPTTKLATSQSANTILDIGCGEGYYTNRLWQALADQEQASEECTYQDYTGQKPANKNTLELIGLDISKDAIRFAAKRNKDITWIVASGAEIPVSPHSQQLITCLFTRLMPEGMSKALATSGKLVVVTTGKQHLLEMRNVLYNDVKEQFMNPEATLNSLFNKVTEQTVQYQHTLISQNQISSLLAMTPHQWRAPESGRLKLQSLNELAITIDVTITVFEPIPRTV